MMWYGFFVVVQMLVYQAAFNFIFLYVAKLFKRFHFSHIMILMIGVTLNSSFVDALYYFILGLFRESQLNTTYSQLLPYSVAYVLAYIRAVYSLYHMLAICFRLMRSHSRSWVGPYTLREKQIYKNSTKSAINSKRGDKRVWLTALRHNLIDHIIALLVTIITALSIGCLYGSWFAALLFILSFLTLCCVCS